MVNDISKDSQKRINTVGPLFNSAIIEAAFKSALEAQNTLQDSLKTHQPAFDALAEQANKLARTFHSFQKNGFLDQLEKIQEDVKAMIEGMTSRLRIRPSDFDSTHVIYVPPPHPQVSEEKIADQVFEKIWNRIEQRAPLSRVFLGQNSVVTLPHGAQWEDVEIRFADDSNIDVYYKGQFLKQYSNEELGFIRKRTKDKTPDKQWGLLKQLALASNNIKLWQPTVTNLANHLKVKPHTCMKTKENLAKKLQAAFGIQSSPFLEYDENRGYRLRFKIQPEANLRYNGNPYPVGVRFNENMSVKNEE